MKIDIKTQKQFDKQFKRLKRRYGKQLAYLNGFADSQLSYTDFVDNFVDKKTVADASIDGNANVGNKDICSLNSEMNKPHSKLLAFNKIHYEMAKKFGEQRADEWLHHEWIGKSYLHDAPSSSWVSYCFAYDLEPLVKKGLFFVDNFNAQPPKHLETYTDFVGEFVSYTSNRTSGACGLPNFLLYSYYFWKKDVEAGYYTVSPEIYRDQEFQRIVYKLNQPYLRVNQSAFTNFSIFDTSYFEALFGGKKFPDGTYIIDYEDEFIQYQKDFMEVCGKIRETNMMTFPVLSYSLLRKNGKFVDEDFAKWCCRHNMKWADSNFMVSKDVTSLSNCCFDGSQMCLTKSDENINLMSFEDLYKIHNEKDKLKIFHAGEWVNGRIIRLPSERRMYKIVTEFNQELIVTDNHLFPIVQDCHTLSDIEDKPVSRLTTNDCLVMNDFPLSDNNSIFEEGYAIGKSMNEDEIDLNYSLRGGIFLAGLLNGYKENRKTDKDGFCVTSKKIASKLECLLALQGLTSKITEVSSDRYEVEYDCNSYAVKINSIEPYDSNAEYVYCFEMENANKPYFTLPNGIISHNCRLVSNVKDLGFFNSLGGTALEVGSVKVNTINLARIAYESKNKQEYLENLIHEVNLCLDCLDAVRHIIVRNVEKGLLPNYSNELLHIKSQYNTIGIIGIYETLQEFGYTTKDKFGYTYYTDEGIEFAKEILATINNTKDNYECDYSINVEQVPAERAAAVLMQKDMIFYPNKTYELPLYGNQFMPLGVKSTLKEKVKIDSTLDKACNGGSISHINIDTPFTDFDTAWEMLNYVADAGVVYFAFCTRISACRHNHGFYGNICPVCGGGKVTTYQRIVGFLTPEKTYSKERKAEFRKRTWFKKVNSSDESEINYVS